MDVRRSTSNLIVLVAALLPVLATLFATAWEMSHDAGAVTAELTSFDIDLPGGDHVQGLVGTVMAGSSRTIENATIAVPGSTYTAIRRQSGEVTRLAGSEVFRIGELQPTEFVHVSILTDGATRGADEITLRHSHGAGRVRVHEAASWSRVVLLNGCGLLITMLLVVIALWRKGAAEASGGESADKHPSHDRSSQQG